jgi:hypothetical protein
MERLVTKSSESNLHYLASLGLAMWTQDCALTGVDPTRIFEYLHTNDVANCQHSLTDMTLTCLALRAAIWNFYGYPRNALQVFLDIFSSFFTVFFFSNLFSISLGIPIVADVAHRGPDQGQHLLQQRAHAYGYL